MTNSAPVALAPTMAMLPAMAWTTPLPPAWARAMTETTLAIVPEWSITFTLPAASVTPVAVQVVDVQPAGEAPDVGDAQTGRARSRR